MRNTLSTEKLMIKSNFTVRGYTNHAKHSKKGQNGLFVWSENLIQQCNVFILLILVFFLFASSGVVAQGDTNPFYNRTIDAVNITIQNPSKDQALNDRAEDAVRRAMALFPGKRYSDDWLNFALSQARRTAGLNTIRVEPKLSAGGGIDLSIMIELSESTQEADGRGALLSGNAAELPLLYDKSGSELRLKLEAFTLYYSNDNAWYGRPDLMLAGNPLVIGEPAGKGYEDWVEGYVHLGLYGITPMSRSLYFYGGLSAMTTASYGQELFTDKTRSYTNFEDAYLGLIGGRTDATGNRMSYNFSFGRQRFTLANAFLIANTAANGGPRGALQANARWAADMVATARIRYNNHMLEFFYVDPDELPLLDSNTKIAGINIELEPLQGLEIGSSYLTVPQSNSNYFGPDGSILGTRKGLQLYDLRFRYSMQPKGMSGPFIGGEIARQTNSNFDMAARAGYVELGYTLQELAWRPQLSYRLSYFSGDDPDTSRYERWDPLLSGGAGDQWVQGANHFKVVQDSNVKAHRFQAYLNVAPKIQLVPQFWLFRANELNNIGGNPALSTLSDHDYGQEFNVTVKYFHSRHLYVHGHLAHTRPGRAVKDALGSDHRNWNSMMLFFRFAL